MEQLAQLESWLLSTVFGVITLGAAGSIGATLLVKLVVFMFRKLINSKDDIIMWFIFPLAREIEVSELICSKYGLVNRDLKYFSCLFMLGLWWVLIGIATMMSAVFLLVVIFTSGLDNGALLSSSIGLFLYLLFAFIKGGVGLLSLIPQDTVKLFDEIEKNYPKSLKEYDKKIIDNYAESHELKVEDNELK